MPSDKTPISLDPDLDPWSQQPAESDAMHHRFLTYLHAGAGRTVRDTAATLSRGRDKPLSVSYVQNLAWQYHWNDRARAWDHEQHRLFLAELDDKRRDMVREQLKDVADLRTALREAHAALDPTAMSWTELARIADTLTKIERAALGEPTHIAVSGAEGRPPVQLAALPATEAEREEQLDAITRRLAAALADGGDIDPATLTDPDGHDEDVEE